MIADLAQVDIPTLDQAIYHKERRKIDTYFQATGPFRRDLYKKHLAFFAAGRTFRERAFIAANRCGKTDGGAYEATLHLTGLYPDWWEGKRFRKPTKGWVAGENSKVVRENLQFKLLGQPGQYGTGFIPADLLRKVTTKQGISEAADTIYVRHVSGGTSNCTLKSFQEGRESFQSASIDFGWADEECELDIWTEMLMRTMTTDGCCWLTFTPLLGLSPLVLDFMPGGREALTDAQIVTG